MVVFVINAILGWISGKLFTDTALHVKLLLSSDEKCITFLLFQDSSGMRLWKRRWFVLADYCLFYYKGE